MRFQVVARPLGFLLWSGPQALGHAGVQHAEFMAKAGTFAQTRQTDFGTQEMSLGWVFKTWNLLRVKDLKDL